MSGFLRRLAAQAMGVAAPVRSTARLPYAAASGFEQKTPESPLALAGRAQIADSPRPRPQTTRQAEEEGAASVRERELLDELADSPRPPASRPDHTTTTSQAEEKGASSVRDRALPIESAIPKEPREINRNTHVHLESREPTDSATISKVTLATGPEKSALERALSVATLLPAQPSTRTSDRAFAPPPSHPATLSGRGTVEETTEVHVSIGRIEVTAVHEAPAPKNPTARKQKPMSLDEYLDRRRGGRQ